MVVDDEIGVHELVRGALLDADMVVVGVRDSRAALDLLEELSCDLMLVETTLPVSGERVLVPVKPSDRYQKVCSDSYLKKPFTDRDVVEFIDRHID